MLNSWKLQARLVRDVELRYVGNNTAVADVGLCWNEYVKDGDNKPHFFDATAWGKTAEFINQYFRKGDEILIEARGVQDCWEDQQGNRRSKVKLVIERVHFIGSRERRDDQPQARQPASQPRRDYAAAGEHTLIDDPEIPF